MHQRLERWPVGLDAVGPGIAGEGRVDLVELRDHARQHVAQRADVAHLGKRKLLGLVHRFEKAGGHERMSLVDVATHGDEMHDREDARAAVIVELKGVEIREQPPHVRIGAKRPRQAAADDRLDVVPFQKFAQRMAGRVLFDRHLLDERR